MALHVYFTDGNFQDLPSKKTPEQSCDLYLPGIYGRLCFIHLGFTPLSMHCLGYIMASRGNQYILVGQESGP